MFIRGQKFSTFKNIFLLHFLPLSLLLYYSMPFRARNIVPTVVSYIFDGWSNPLFTLLMFFSTLIDYVCGLMISVRPATMSVRRKRQLLPFPSLLTCRCSVFSNTPGLLWKIITGCPRYFGGNGFDPVPVLHLLLLLGVSFATIYSSISLGWGSSAGLAEQLSRVPQLPVDFIARNDNGAYATGEILALELAREQQPA